MFSVCLSKLSTATDLEHRQCTELLGDQSGGRGPGLARGVRHQQEVDRRSHRSGGSLSPGCCMLAAIRLWLAECFYRLYRAADKAALVHEGFAVTWSCEYQG